MNKHESDMMIKGAFLVEAGKLLEKLDDNFYNVESSEKCSNSGIRKQFGIATKIAMLEKIIKEIAAYDPISDPLCEKLSDLRQKFFRFKNSV